MYIIIVELVTSCTEIEFNVACPVKPDDQPKIQAKTLLNTSGYVYL